MTIQDALTLLMIAGGFFCVGIVVSVVSDFFRMSK